MSTELPPQHRQRGRVQRHGDRFAIPLLGQVAGPPTIRSSALLGTRITVELILRKLGEGATE